LPDHDVVAKRVEINGIVQGVGFRPFVYTLARRYDLTGDVANTSSGVVIHIEGSSRNIGSFLKDLAENHPPLACITEILHFPEKCLASAAFSISGSQTPARFATFISPDVAVCEDCRRELRDPVDRRFRYPFINCTNCGPRYTIIDDIPYDRPGTSMKDFVMCPACHAEYDDPANRRFHAQPNACAACGPNMRLLENAGKDLAAPDPVDEAAKRLKAGYVVAIKGLGGFHLVVDAVNDEAVKRLRTRKHREEKPFALMAGDMAAIETFAHVTPEETRLLGSSQRPIVLLRKREGHTLSPWVSPKNMYFGTMLPYTPLHYLLFDHGFAALVMTSGNRSEEPIAIENMDALRRLSHIADYFLVHNRDIYLRCDDSIARYNKGAVRIIRRARGYVPAPVFLKHRAPPVLACGAALKNTVCLTREDNAFISQHIGDLENPAAYDFFCETIDRMKRILGISPQLIACDQHPDYLSTRYAEEQQSLPKVRVQHHHAHIGSVMAENQIDGPVIGLAFDGSGLGTDNTIWGGEVLMADLRGFSRMAHFSALPMPGGAAAIKEPWRMAVSYLFDAFGEQLFDLDLPLFTAVDLKKIQAVVEMTKKRINSPLTSSLGRLFDGVSAICGIRYEAAFEGQAAMELEMAAVKGAAGGYDGEWMDVGKIDIPTGPIIRQVVGDMINGISPAVISQKFHATLIRLFSRICAGIRRETGVNTAALSGGVFQNATLLSGMIHSLENKGFDVFSNSRVPANDGGICLGQALIAAAQVWSGRC
jgi:hydrogenase maturation protein HypF